MTAWLNRYQNPCSSGLGLPFGITRSRSSLNDRRPRTAGNSVTPAINAVAATSITPRLIERMTIRSTMTVSTSMASITVMPE